MKKSKYVFSLVLSIAFMFTVVSPLYADTTTEVSEEDYGYVIENGVQRKIRFVTEEEYHLDETNDFLIIDASDSTFYDNSPLISTYKIDHETKMMYKGVVIGILAQEVWKFIGGSGITQAVFAKMVAKLVAMKFAIPVLISLAVVVVIFAGSTTTIEAPSIGNKKGCFWRGSTALQGQWDCPMRIAYEGS